MDKIKVRKNGIALLMLALLAGNLTMDGWAKGRSLTGAQPQQAKKAPAKVPVPADWITIEDEELGYSFEVPKGTEQTVNKKDNVVFIQAVLPAPITATVHLFVFRGKQLTKEEIRTLATDALKRLGVKTSTVGELAEADKQSSVADYTATRTDDVAIKGKALVATGIKDSYLMLVSSDAARFKANEEIIDEIWGSFSIPPSGAHISDLTLGKDKAMRQPTEEFTTTETIFAAVKISKNEGTVKVIGRLHVVAIAGQKPGPIPGIETTVMIKGEGTANFQYSKPTKGWPLGKYKFEAEVLAENGEQKDVQSYEFTVT